VRYDISLFLVIAISFKVFRNWLASDRSAVSLYPSAARLCTSAYEEAVAVAEIALAMSGRHSWAIRNRWVRHDGPVCHRPFSLSHITLIAIDVL
jgi:hypothetical protein